MVPIVRIARSACLHRFYLPHHMCESYMLDGLIGPAMPSGRDETIYSARAQVTTTCSQLSREAVDRTDGSNKMSHSHEPSHKYLGTHTPLRCSCKSCHHAQQAICDAAVRQKMASLDMCC